MAYECQQCGATLQTEEAVERHLDNNPNHPARTTFRDTQTDTIITASDLGFPGKQIRKTIREVGEKSDRLSDVRDAIGDLFSNVNTNNPQGQQQAAQMREARSIARQMGSRGKEGPEILAELEARRPQDFPLVPENALYAFANEADLMSEKGRIKQELQAKRSRGQMLKDYAISNLPITAIGIIIAVLLDRFLLSAVYPGTPSLFVMIGIIFISVSFLFPKG